MRPYILFSVAGTTYAVKSDLVRHMEMIEQVTSVPNAPGFVEGVVYSRGQVVPVLNLRVRFGFERVARDLRARLLVVDVGGRLLACWPTMRASSCRSLRRQSARPARPSAG